MRIKQLPTKTNLLNMPSKQYKYYILTVPKDKWTPYTTLPEELSYVSGQNEISSGTNYDHWQIVIYFKKPITVSGAKKWFGLKEAHFEATRSDAARKYCSKSDTSVEGSWFMFGKLPARKNDKTDWAIVKEQAQSGKLDDIDADVFVRNYFSLKRIAKDYASAPYRKNVKVNVFCGVTGSGKSHRAFEEAEKLGKYYVKSSTTKWWDGYRGEEVVIIDEFRGLIGIEHMLKWLDRYPCYVEEKGGNLPLMATTFYICSNLVPRAWYDNLDLNTVDALERRLNNVVLFKEAYVPPIDPPGDETCDMDMTTVNSVSLGSEDTFGFVENGWMEDEERKKVLEALRLFE